MMAKGGRQDGSVVHCLEDRARRGTWLPSRPHLRRKRSAFGSRHPGLEIRVDFQHESQFNMARMSLPDILKDRDLRRGLLMSFEL